MKTMKTYDVFRSPVTGIHKAIKRGFSFPGFCFSWMWMWNCGVPRLAWPEGRLMIGWMICFYGAAQAMTIGFIMWFNDPFDGTGLEQPELVKDLMSTLQMLTHAFIGIKGNAWLVRDLTEKGWLYLGPFQSNSPYNAMQEAKKAAADE